MSQSINTYRPLLFSIAYNMTGLASNSEDLVQEAFLRYYEASEKREIQNPKGYLVRIITNLAMNHFESAQQQRVDYPGVWLPEPVYQEQPENYAREDALKYSTLVLLEKLTAHERAVFVLREALDYEYDAIAEFIDSSEENCRKILSRAKAKLPSMKKSEIDEEQHQKLLESLLDALNKGDNQELLNLFSEDIALYADGGGKKTASMKPVKLPKYVARFLSGISRMKAENLEIQWLQVNSQPAIGIWLNDLLDSIWLLEIVDNKVQNIFIQRNPDKLSDSIIN